MSSVTAKGGVTVVLKERGALTTGLPRAAVGEVRLQV
jgi:hypothetical protein